MVQTKQIENSNSQKFLLENIDSKLGFEKHINTISGKDKAKISALGRVLS